jgi:hypothetical protein
MRKLFCGLLLTAALVHAQTLIAHGCYGLGANGGTTPALDTTGANFVVVNIAIDSYYYGQLSDSNSNHYTTLTHHLDSPILRMYYTDIAPTVGAGHTWTVAQTGIYVSVCVEAWSGIVQPSPFDAGMDVGVHSASATSLATGSMTPSAGRKLVVTAMGLWVAGATPYTVDSSFTNVDGVLPSSGVNYGSGMASLVQSTGAAVNPTWSESGSACLMTVAQAAFKVSATAPKRRVVVVN